MSTQTRGHRPAFGANELTLENVVPIELYPIGDQRIHRGCSQITGRVVPPRIRPAVVITTSERQRDRVRQRDSERAQRNNQATVESAGRGTWSKALTHRIGCTCWDWYVLTAE